MHPPCAGENEGGASPSPPPPLLPPRSSTRSLFESTERRAPFTFWFLFFFSRKLRAIFAGLANARRCAPPRTNRIPGAFAYFSGVRSGRCQLTLIGARDRLLLLIAGPGNLSRRTRIGGGGREGGRDLFPFLRLYLDANSVVIYHRLSRGTTRNYRLGRSSF